MNHTLIAFLFISLFTINQPLWANNGKNTVRENSIKENGLIKYQTDGKPILVQPVILGEVCLYRKPHHELKPDAHGRMSYHMSFTYFIGKEEIESIGPLNYRELIKKYMSDASELHRKLGRKGFRYENIPSMILYYNRFKSDQPVGLKYDMRKTIALLMETE